MRLISNLFVMDYSYYKMLKGNHSKEEYQNGYTMIETIKELLDDNKIIIILPPEISYKQASQIATRGIIPTDKDWRGIALFYPEDIDSHGSKSKIAEEFADFIQKNVEAHNITNVLLITDIIHFADIASVINKSKKMKYNDEIFYQQQLSKLGLHFITRKAPVYETIVNLD
jgi:hypothetical protein